MKKIDFSIVLIHDGVNKLTFFTIFDFIMLVFCLTIVLILSAYIKSVNSDKPHYSYFFQNLYFKIFFSLAFALYYIFFIQGGDTIAFFDASRILTNLLKASPEQYINEWSTYTQQDGYVSHFTGITGFPPGWIAREKEAYFVSKIFSIFNLLSGSSYLANTVLISFISAISSFKLYDFVVSFGIHDYKKLVFPFLFLPSLSFWCTGVSKDSLILICIYFLIPLLYNLIARKSKSFFLNIILIILLTWILFNIRSFMIATIIVPFMFAFNVQFSKKYISNKSIQRIFRFMVVAIGLSLIGVNFSGETAQKYLNEAEITQQDFKNNTTYTGEKYDLGNVSYTPLGLLKAMPLSIFTGIYRPFPWEALSPGLILNGIESAIFLYLSFVFLTNKRSKRISKIRESDILTFSLYLVLIFAFMTGFTSMIFGVLVRLRAPLLPFFVLLLTVNPDDENNEETIGSESPIISHS